MIKYTTLVKCWFDHHVHTLWKVFRIPLIDGKMDWDTCCGRKQKSSLHDYLFIQARERLQGGKVKSFCKSCLSLSTCITCSDSDGRKREEKRKKKKQPSGRIELHLSALFQYILLRVFPMPRWDSLTSLLLCVIRVIQLSRIVWKRVHAGWTLMDSSALDFTSLLDSLTKTCNTQACLVHIERITWLRVLGLQQYFKKVLGFTQKQGA